MQCFRYQVVKREGGMPFAQQASLGHSWVTQAFWNWSLPTFSQQREGQKINN
jgi:hypothetical protein